MISPEFSTFFTIIIYAMASFLGLAGMILRKNTFRNGACWLAGMAFLCQTVILMLGFHKFFPLGLSIGAYLQMFAWFILFCGLGVWLIYRQQSLLLFAAQFGFFLFLMSAPWLNNVIYIPSTLKTSFYILHLGALFLFIGIISIAFFTALMFIFISYRIKNKMRMDGFWKDLPSLSVLDKINSFCVVTSFPLFTIGIACGLIWSSQIFGNLFDADPKKIVSLFVWLLLAILFHNRLANGWKGRKPAILIVFIFLVSLFSMFIINIYFPTLHKFV